MLSKSSQQKKELQLQSDIKRLRNSLGDIPERVVCPSFVVVSGLPGAGKSVFCRRLAEKSSFCVMESDFLRKVLFESPNHSTEENTRLFTACHKLIKQLLQEGVPLVFDATNLSEYHREYLYAISERTNAKLVLVRVIAPEDIVRERLDKRSKSIANGNDRSDADWDVYKRMESRSERINRSHLVVDTSRDIMPVIDKIVRVINHRHA